MAVLNYVMGALNLSCGGCFAVVGVFFFAAFHAHNSRLDSAFREIQQEMQELDDGDVEVTFPTESDVFELGPMGLTEWLLLVLVMILAFLGISSLLAGYGVQRRRPWGRILTIVLAGLCSILALLHLINLSPFALLYGGYSVYVLVILLKAQYAEEFA